MRCPSGTLFYKVYEVEVLFVDNVVFLKNNNYITYDYTKKSYITRITLRIINGVSPHYLFLPRSQQDRHSDLFYS